MTVLTAPAPDRQILRGVAATLSFQSRDSDGVATAPSGTVTIGVTEADGTTVVSAGTATSGSSTDPRTYSLAAQNTLEMLTVTWTDGGDSSTHVQLVEVVGGYYFTPEQYGARFGPKNPADVVLARRAVEEACELLTGVAWVPRYRRVRLDGTGCNRIKLPDPMLRSVRSVRVYTDATTYTSWTSDEVAAVATTGGGGAVAEEAAIGVAVRLDGGWWPSGHQNIVVEYEHGFDRPPQDIRDAAMDHCRSVLVPAPLVTAGAERWTAPDGMTIFRAIPLATRLGMPEIDAVYERHSFKIPGIA